MTESIIEMTTIHTIHQVIDVAEAINPNLMFLKVKQSILFTSTKASLTLAFQICLVLLPRTVLKEKGFS